MFVSSRINADRSTGRAGFSLFEVVIMLAIIAVLAGIAIPRYVDSLDSYRIDMAVRRVEMDLALARDHAHAISAPVTVSFSIDPAPSEYTISGLEERERPGVPYSVRLFEEPYHVIIKSVDFGGDGVLSFNGHALPDTGGQIVLRSGLRERIVTVDSVTSEDIVE